MPFKPFDDILTPDPRFADRCVVEGGTARRMTLADRHRTIAGINLSDAVPKEVDAAFDRVRNTVIYAFFDYDLFVVGEVQAFGAFELALKHRLNGHGGTARGTLCSLVDRARKGGHLPTLTSGANPLSDPIETLIALRNGLSHGTSDVHSPGMALEVVGACAFWISHLYPVPP
ncbi:MAG TPA: hypothetical protein VFA03_02265 [Acetobacteraceae bacterium]|nr:hypothetical protein [Acetobacteraceae bacterium]